jgi:alpha-tubulin suppressor-like RCC1 family protein
LGELGNRTTTNSSTPVPVSGLTGITAISAGGDSTCALLTNGTVDCWGDNFFGELGIGTMTGPDTCSPTVASEPCSTSPVQVTGLTGVTAISAGGDNANCALLANGTVNALLTNGTVDCWGSNLSGQLGIGTTTGPDNCGGEACSTTLVEVTGLTGVTAISAGGGSTMCALLTNGTVDCRGDNTDGALGNGTTTSSSTPAPVEGL